MRYFFAILNPHYVSYKAYCIKIKHLMKQLHLTRQGNQYQAPGTSSVTIYVIPKSRLSIFLKITAGTSCNLLIVFLREKSGKVEILPFTHDCLQTWLWFDFDILLHGTSTIGSSKYCILGSKLKSFVVFGQNNSYIDEPKANYEITSGHPGSAEGSGRQNKEIELKMLDIGWITTPNAAGE